MFRQNSTIKLLGLLGVLIAVYLVVSLTKDTSKSKSLKRELVNINADKVDQFVLIKNNKQFTINKEGEEWDLTLANGRKVKTKKNSVKNAVSALKTIKPSRLVSKTKDKWSVYQVDSSGYQVQTYEEGKKSLDIVIGKLGVENQQSFHTFVRLSDDEETYRANNFMSFSVPGDEDGYRNGLLFSLKKDSVEKISFNYNEEPFVLENQASGWQVNGEEADSAATAAFFSDISYANSTGFLDEVENYTLPTASLTIKMKNGEQKTIDAFVDGDKKVLKSSDNEDELFEDAVLHNKLFKSLSDFK